jgi:hypothetical protein
MEERMSGGTHKRWHNASRSWEKSRILALISQPYLYISGVMVAILIIAYGVNGLQMFYFIRLIEPI